MTTSEHEQSEPADSERPRRWRTAGRVARLLGWVVGLSLAVAALAIGGTLTFAGTERGRETLRRVALAQARKSIPGLQIGRIDGDYLQGLVLRDVEVRDESGQPAVHVDHLSLRYRLGALWRRTISVSEIEIDGVAVTARPDGRGGLNLAHLTAPSEPARSPAPQGKPSGWKVQVDRILVSRVTGTLELPDGRTGSLTGFNLDAAARIDGQRLQAEIAALAASGTWEAQNYSASLSGGAFTLAPSEVAARLAALRVTGLFPEGTPLVLRLDARGPRERVSTTLDLDGGAAGRVHLAGTAGVISDAQGKPTLGAYDLGVALSDVDPGGIKADAPRGAINLRLQAAGDGIVRTPGSRATLALELLPSHLEGYAFSSTRVAASLVNDRWEVARAVLLRTAGASLTVEGHGAGDDVAAALALDVAGPMRQLPAANGIAGRGRPRHPCRGNGSRSRGGGGQGELHPGACRSLARRDAAGVGGRARAARTWAGDVRHQAVGTWKNDARWAARRGDPRAGWQPRLRRPRNSCPPDGHCRGERARSSRRCGLAPDRQPGAGRLGKPRGSAGPARGRRRPARARRGPGPREGHGRGCGRQSGRALAGRHHQRLPAEAGPRSAGADPFSRR